jgi:hypothetical protein
MNRSTSLRAHRRTSKKVGGKAVTSLLPLSPGNGETHYASTDIVKEGCGPYGVPHLTPPEAMGAVWKVSRDDPGR